MTYTPGIPNPGDFISQSQPVIKSNFTVANTAFGVDHTAFDVAPNQGKHKKVTLIDQGATPVADAAGPLIFSRTVKYPNAPGPVVNKIDEFTRMASGDGSTLIALTAFFNAPITGATGSSFIPGIPAVSGADLTSAAVVLKWGSAAITGASQTWASLGQTDFPTDCFAMLVTSTDPAYTNSLAVTAKSKSAFTVTRSNGAGNTGYYYIAIGN